MRLHSLLPARGTLAIFSFSLLVGCDRTLDDVEPPHVRAKESLTTTFERQLVLPAATGLHSVALGASESLKIGDGVVVSAPDQIERIAIVNAGSGTTEIGATAILGSGNTVVDIHAGGGVFLREGAVVTGDLTAAGTFTTQNQWSVGGDVQHDTAVPLAEPLVWTVAFEQSSVPLLLEPDQALALAPGAWSSVTVKPRAELTLSTGSYYFDTFDVHSDGKLVLDDSSGAVLVFVRSSVSFRGKVLGPQASERFLVAYVGSQPVTIDAPFAGSVLAPDALLRLSPVDGSGHDGSFFAKSIEADAWNPIRYRTFRYWDLVFPPTVTARCLSRAKLDHAAGIFDINNPLDVPVTISPGAENTLSADILRNGPLEVFPPGKHPKAYWVRFGGQSLAWTLRGRTSIVSEQTRHCTIDDYNLAPSDVATQSGGGTWTGPGHEENDEPPDFKPAPLTSLTFTTPPLAPADDIVLLLEVTGMSIGDNDGGFGGSEPFIAFDGTKINTGRFASFTRTIPAGTAPTYSLHFGDRDSGLNGSDDIMIGAHLEVNGAQGTVVVVDAWNEDGGSVNISPCDPPRANCFVTGNFKGWQMRFEATIVSKPRLCAHWRTQYIDSGFGEDMLTSVNPTLLPATYALAKLSVSGGDAPFSAWTGYFPLDADGCVPEEFSPSVRQLTTSGTIADVTLTLGGKIQSFDGLTSISIVDDTDASFTVDARPETNAEVSARVDLSSGTLNEMTRAAAAASHIVALQENRGIDMGIARGFEMKINARSDAAATHVKSPHVNPSTGVLHLRPTQGLSPSDASSKDIVGHEFGHMVQLTALGGMVNFSYNLLSFDARGVPTKVTTWPAMNPACDCDYVQEEFSTAHCMQSFETMNAAQLEGFATAYGARMFNEISEGDCYVPYPKWMLLNSCPSGKVLHTDCFDLNNLTPADQATLAMALRTIPNVADLDPNKGWFLVRPPVILSCSDTTKWRNTECIDPTVATPDLLNDGGTELDWTQFYWALTAPGVDPDDVWTISDTFKPYREACGGTFPCNVQMTWTTLRTAVERVTDANLLSVGQESRFDRIGRSCGVDNARLP